MVKPAPGMDEIEGCLLLDYIERDASRDQANEKRNRQPRRSDGRRLNHFFEARCDADPTRLAVDDGTKQWTYGQLEAEANRLAGYLQSRGIGSGSRVGLLLPRSIQTYVSLLGVLKSGAAFVPLDLSFPADRVEFISVDSDLSAIITTAALAARLDGNPCPLFAVEEIAPVVAGHSSTRPAVPSAKPDAEELCYIIYTSGTTGRPKGVAVSQANICNFIDVVRDIYGVVASDRAYQGMTVAFDFSMEEIWPALDVGACLVVGPVSDRERFGAGLGRFLAEQRVTVFACVPTLLATLEDDVPSIRLLLVGGEACPQELITRWSRRGRRMLNTYGPTEATITATWTELAAHKAVTIGRPFPTYTARILDEELNAVGPGVVGELHIGGAGVAVGYVNRPELTREKFIPDPNAPGGRLYKTGDLCRFAANGEIEFLGRCDTQVKIRGYRIELSEIESILREEPEVENVVAAAWSSESGLQELVAYIKPRQADTLPAFAAWHTKLSHRLPVYMVPAFLEILGELPVLPSGKVDRARLPAPAGPRMSVSRKVYLAPEGDLEEVIARAWAELFQQDRISVEDDFFDDLGGHSLLAALVVSALRRDPRTAHLGLGDLYAYPTVRKLAGHVAEEIRRAESKEKAGETKEPRIPAGREFGRCGLAQALAIYALLFIAAIELLLPMRLWHEPAGVVDFVWMTARIVMSSLGLILAVSLVLPLAVKWLVLGRCQAGTYPLWGSYFFRWWLVRKALGIAPLRFMAGSPLLPIYFRLFGARIGRDCHLGTQFLGEPDMLEIGAGASIGAGTQIYGHTVSGGQLHIGPVRIGEGCYLGNNSLVLPGAVMENHARLGDQSLLASGETIPAGEHWNGSPARPEAAPDAAVEEMAANEPALPGPLRRGLTVLAYGLGIFGLLVVPAFAVLPGVMLMVAAERAFAGWWFLAVTPAAAVLCVVCFCAAVVAIKRLVVPRVRTGLHSAHGGFYFRKWFTDNLVEMSLGMVQALYATLYLAPWLRLLGAKIGRLAEISTAAHITPDLLRIEDESFIADAACIGPARVFKNVLSIAPTTIGRRSFLGNSGFMPGNSTLPDGCLIGVLSVPPVKPAEPGTSWLGSPALCLPRRQQSEHFGDTLTFAPTKRLYLQRLFVEFFRVIIPTTLQFAVAGALVCFSISLLNAGAFFFAAALFPLAYLAAAGLATGVVLAIKKALIGTYRPLVRPLWSHFVWRTELVTGAYENVAVPMLLSLFAGTPFLAPILRAFGARIGRRVFMETTYLTEFDLVSVGDEAQIGPFASLQTHLFEDRVMKMSHVRVGPGCSIGPRAVVLYDSVMEEGASLEGLSLLMKGETLPRDTHWRGSPASRCD
jgi:non-ribosomal peptide synthetase-like protein